MSSVRNDSITTDTLRELREKAGLSQEEAGKWLNVNRKQVGKYESGESIPREGKREYFILYLWDGLGLKDDRILFGQIWEDIMINLWGWNSITNSEKYKYFYGNLDPDNLALTNQPSLPPDLIVPELIGRNDLITEFIQFLNLNTWMVLTGKAGVGKTALAATLAKDKRIQEQYPAGFLWASLGQSPHIPNILAYWAKQLNRDISRLGSIRDQAQAIRNAIGEKKYLIIIDDVWDLPTIKKLLVGGANSSYLVTTRDESVAQGLTTIECIRKIHELNEAKSYQLLQSLAPQICKTYPDQCREVSLASGGLPLQLVLVGGYLKGTRQYTHFPETAAEIISTLSDPQQFLSLSGPRLGSDDNEQLTLEATITLSLKNLSAKTQSTFYALGAFAPKPRKFHRVAAEFVCQADVAMLTTLVDRNLLEIYPDGWLSIHKSVADIARTKLSHESMMMHSYYYLQLLCEGLGFDGIVVSKIDESGDALVEQMIGDDNSPNWNQIHPIYEQIDWLFTSLDDQYIPMFSSLLFKYQSHFGLWEDGFKWTERALTFAIQEGNKILQCRLLQNLGKIHFATGELDKAENYYEKSLDICVQIEAIEEEMFTRLELGNIKFARGYWNEAWTAYETALQIATTQNHASVICVARLQKGHIFVEKGNFDDARGEYHASLEISRQLGHISNERAALEGVASTYAEQGQIKQAIILSHDILDFDERFQNLSGQAVVLGNMGTYYLKLKDSTKAEEYIKKSLDISHKIQNPHGVGLAYLNLSKLQLQLADKNRIPLGHLFFNLKPKHKNNSHLDKALEYSEKSRSIFEKIESNHDLGKILTHIAYVYYIKGDQEKARSFFKLSLTKLHPDSPVYSYAVRSLIKIKIMRQLEILMYLILISIVAAICWIISTSSYGFEFFRFYR